MFQSATKIEAVNLCQDLVAKALIALYPPAKDDVEIKQKQKNENSDESQKEIEEVNEQEKEDISKEIKEVKEQEKEDISQDDIVETIESKPCEIEVACLSEFLLKISQSDYSQSEFLISGVLSGFKCMSNGVKFPKSLIECTIHHKQDLQTLMFLGLGSSFILRVEDMSDLTVHGEQKTYLCTESVVTLESHFTLKCEEWRGNQKHSNLSDEQRSNVFSEWWNFIKSDFIEVFRVIVDGLVYLYSRGCACGDLLHSAFVTQLGHGRILPSMNSTATHLRDMHDLGILMKRIIYLPIPGPSIEKYLPNEVQLTISFFEYFKNEKDHLPFSWIIDQPLFWTPLKRANFMINLRRKMPNYSSFYRVLEESLVHGSISYEEWFNMIPDDGIYREIFREGDLFDEESNIRVQPYLELRDIVRYMNAVYGHHNDARYSSFRKKVLELSEIDAELRQIFPNVHELAYFALCKYFIMISKRDSSTNINIHEFDVNSKDWKLPPLVN